MIELIISHDGKYWIAENDLLYAKADTLKNLDDKLKALVKQKKLIRKNEKSALFMAFDNSNFPQWMRQYSQHYFNRILQLD